MRKGALAPFFMSYINRGNRLQTEVHILYGRKFFAAILHADSQLTRTNA